MLFILIKFKIISYKIPIKNKIKKCKNLLFNKFNRHIIKS